jgi:hypothetical protein
MGIRESLNKNQKIVVIATVAVTLFGFGIIFWEAVRSSGGTSDTRTEAYFTVNDGATYFADSIDRVPPFDHAGQQAVRARVFTCQGKKAWVAYLEKYPDDVAASAAAQAGRMAGSASAPEPGQAMMPNAIMLVKAPGTGNDGWVPQNQPAATAIIKLQCPDGTTDSLEPVEP